MYKPKSEQEKILHRLQIARGHLEKVIKMFQHNDYCIDILHQSNAVARALQEVDHLILENHLETCVINDIQSGNTEKTIGEIMSVIRKSSE